MVAILFTICSLPFLVIASSHINSTDLTFHQKCNPLLQCNAYFSVAGFAEVSWLEANYICNRVGAVLATVRNEEQHQLMLHYVNRKERIFGNRTFWLGATNLVDRSYFWTWMSTGIPVTYAQWSRREPKSDRTGQDACLVLGTDNLWHSEPCQRKHNFICENVCQLNYSAQDKRVYI
ncbi:rheacalcin-2 [Drosophila simulans]|uniref:GD10332 n=1 Tax=Drosophila simulans TaxID=7240 RepID=B4QD74_DROSI|nr:rheacalcin-2 [Drosophila simulans]EDX05861.1 GD10332 [Drosophila simulans]KMY91711.1 uncharacterized protein Dsimw501_GD10332 [Drosophila simulans]